jgi:hypothetical protein
MSEHEPDSGDAIVTVGGATREMIRLGLDLSESAVRKAVDTGELPAEKAIGTGYRFIRLAAVHAFIQARLSR